MCSGQAACSVVFAVVGHDEGPLANFLTLRTVTARQLLRPPTLPPPASSSDPIGLTQPTRASAATTATRSPVSALATGAPVSSSGVDDGSETDATHQAAGSSASAGTAVAAAAAPAAAPSGCVACALPSDAEFALSLLHPGAGVGAAASDRKGSAAPEYGQLGSGSAVSGSQNLAQAVASGAPGHLQAPKPQAADVPPDALAAAAVSSTAGEVEFKKAIMKTWKAGPNTTERSAKTSDRAAALGGATTALAAGGGTPHSAPRMASVRELFTGADPNEPQAPADPGRPAPQGEPTAALQTGAAFQRGFNPQAPALQVGERTPGKGTDAASLTSPELCSNYLNKLQISG